MSVCLSVPDSRLKKAFYTHQGHLNSSAPKDDQYDYDDQDDQDDQDTLTFPLIVCQCEPGSDMA